MTRARTAIYGAIVLLTVLCGCARSPEARRDKYLARGKTLLEKKDYSRAILEFKNAARETPNDADVYYQLGSAAMAGADLRLAVRAFTKALELNPKHNGAQLKLAQIAAAAGDPEWVKQSEQRLQALIQEHPQDPDALHTLALTELRLGDSSNAVRHLELALSAAPHDLLLAATLAQEKLRQNDPKAAEDILKKASTASPTSADAVVFLGILHASLNRTAEAEQEFKRALTLDSRHAAALLNLAMLQRRLGRNQEADQNFKRLTTFSEKAVKPLYGIYLFQEGRRQEAVKEFERLVREYPGERAFRTDLVVAYQGAGRLGDANKVLSDALKKNPKDLDALLQRAELSLGSGKYGEAEADLNAVLRMKPDSPEVHYAIARLHAVRGSTLLQRKELTETLRLNPNLLPVRIDLAKLLISENAGKAALAVLDETPAAQKDRYAVLEQRIWAYLSTGQQAEARAGIDHGLASSRSPELLLADAIWKMQKQQYAAARDSLHEALKASPEDLRILRVLAGSYAAQKNVAGAVADVRAHAAKYPKSAPIQYFLGSLLLESGDRAQALQALTAAKSANANFIPVDLSLARINLLQSNWNDARQQLAAVISNNGENVQARQWLGMLEAATGNSAAAIAHFRKVIESQPENATALNNLAYLLAESGNTSEEPLQYAQKAVELQPDNPEFEDTLGWVLYHRAVYGMAVKHLEVAVARQPTALRYLHLAMAYHKAGQESQARATLQTGLKLGPTLPEAKTAREMFGQAP